LGHLKKRIRLANAGFNFQLCLPRLSANLIFSGHLISAEISIY